MGFKRMALLSATAAAGLLTHFYYWIWLALFSACYLTYLAVTIPTWKNKFNAVGRYIGAMLSALLCMTAVFPNWYTNIFINTSTKGYSSLAKIFSGSNLWEEFLKAIKVSSRFFMADSGTAGALALFLLILIIYKSLGKGDYKLWLMIISSVCYAVFVTHTQPTSEGRYLWSSSLILYIAFLYMLMEIFRFTGEKIQCNWQRVLSFCIAVLLILNVCTSLNTENIQYLRNRSVQQEKAIKAETDCPWIVFYDHIDWKFMCTAFDLMIPQYFKRVRTEVQGAYDEIIQEAEKIIVYTDYSIKPIEECMQYIMDSCNREIKDYEQIGISHSMYVYRINLR